MFATLISIILVGFLWWGQGFEDTTLFPRISLVAGSVVWLATILLNVLIWIPLQRLEKNTIPRVGEFISKSFKWKAKQTYLSLFVLLSFVLGLSTGNTWFLSTWVVLLGIALDCFYASCSQFAQSLNPLKGIQFLGHAAEDSIKSRKTLECCQWTDALSEVALKSIQNGSLSLSDTALKELESVANSVVIKYSVNLEDKTEQIFLLSYLFQRFQLLHSKAVDAHIEPVASFIIASLGKITLLAAKTDPSLVALTLYFLGECTADAQKQGLNEVAVKATLTLQEVAKEASEDERILRMSTKELYLNLINQQEKIAKTTFKQDKTINLALLTEPFRELKKLFLEGKLASHPDAEIISQDLSRVLSEFEALEVILKTVPNIPGFSPSEQKT